MSSTQRLSTRARRGQVLVIAAAAMMVLLGICAIVIDLGFSWMLRRQEQNAADPAALAAARYLPESGMFTVGSPEHDMAVEAACFYARENGFFPGAADNDGCIPTNDPDGATLSVNAPPVGDMAGSYQSRAGFVQVVISRSHESFFGRIYSPFRPVVTTNAVVANTDGNANSSSLVALDPGCNGTGGGKISGNNALVKIVPAPGVTDPGGYVHVNSSCTDHPDGDPSTCSNGSADLKVDSGTLIAPHAYVYGTCGGSGDVCGPGPAPTYEPPNCTVEPVTEGAGRIGDPLEALRPPTIAEVNAAYGVAQCPDGSDSTPTSNPCDFRASKCDDPDGTPVCELEPGVYYGGWSITQAGTQVKLSPGIYYIAGGGIRLNSGTIESVSGDPTVDARVMIYSTDHPTDCTAATLDDCQGPIRLSASGDFNAKALNDTTCAAQPITCPYRGILLWQDQWVLQPGQEVRLGGQNSSVVSGTIYAPKSNVTLDGGSNGTGCQAGPNMACLSVQIIAWSFDVVGGGVLEMPYDPAGLYQLVQKGLVH
jgi:hypothetical protein